LSFTLAPDILEIPLEKIRGNPKSNGSLEAAKSLFIKVIVLVSVLVLVVVLVVIIEIFNIVSSTK
jgi:hypothetical protein